MSKSETINDVYETDIISQKRSLETKKTFTENNIVYF